MSAGEIDPVSQMLGQFRAELQRGHDERQRIFQLLDKHGDVLGEQGAVLQSIKAGGEAIKTSLDTLTGKDGRLAKVEAVAADYTRTKNRAMGLFAGASLGGAGLGAALHEFAKRWLA